MTRYLVFTICFSIMLVGCVNSSTNFSNRGVTYQVTPELLGDQAYVSHSPTTADATVNAEKTNELKANGSAYGAVTDNSTNEQKSSENTAQEQKSSENKQDDSQDIDIPSDN